MVEECGSTPEEYGSVPEEFHENESFSLEEFHIFSLCWLRHPQFL